MNESSALTRPDPPWLRLAEQEPAAESRVDAGIVAVRDAGGMVVTMSGRRLRTETDFLDSFARDWEFPEYFGGNPAALEDCLSDLSWLPPAPARLLVIEDAEEMLSAESPTVVAMYLGVLERVCASWAEPIEQGQWWDRPAVPFHVLFVATTACAGSGLSRRWATGDVEISRL